MSRLQENFLEIQKNTNAKKLEKIFRKFFHAFIKYWKHCGEVSIRHLLFFRDLWSAPSWPKPPYLEHAVTREDANILDLKLTVSTSVSKDGASTDLWVLQILIKFTANHFSKFSHLHGIFFPKWLWWFQQQSKVLGSRGSFAHCLFCQKRTGDPSKKGVLSLRWMPPTTHWMGWFARGWVWIR